MKAILVFLASLITVYSVGCANGCSGHGTCSAERECLCFRQQGLGLNDGDFEDFGWTGADCSIRMCPQGLSFAPQSSQNKIRWFNSKSEAYKATYDFEKQNFLSALNENKYKLITIDADLSENMEAGGRAICYDGDMNFLVNIDVFQGMPLNEVNEVRKTQLYGIPTSFANDTATDPNDAATDPNDDIENELKKIAYCRVPYIRKDLSLFTFFTLKQTEDEKKDSTETTWTRILKGEAIKDIIAYIGRPNKFEVDIACRNMKTVDVKSQYITVHTVTVETTVQRETLTESNEIILTIDKSEKIEGSCSFLYSPLTASSISLKESELYNLVGTENYFGYQIEDGVLLWVDNKNETDFSVTNDTFKLTTKTYTNADFNDITYDRVSKSEGEVRQIMQKGKEVAIISFGVSKVYNISNTTTTDVDDKGNLKIPCDYNTEMTFATIKTVEKGSENEETGRIDYEITVTPKPFIYRKANQDDKPYFLPVGILISNVGPHMYAECSGAGTCNRNTGKCECYEGYYGSACQRMKCPNDCSKRGKCLTASEYFTLKDGDTYYGDSILPVCKCDGGYRGIDCSQIECPSSDDPNQATNLKQTDGKTVNEFRDCSGRGVCDYSNGKCECFKGYAGDACNILLSTY